MDKIFIKTEFIKLGQALKLSSLIDQGSDVKIYITQGNVYVNGNKVFERGKKLYSGDKVELQNKGSFEIYTQENV